MLNERWRIQSEVWCKNSVTPNLVNLSVREFLLKVRHLATCTGPFEFDTTNRSRNVHQGPTPVIAATIAIVPQQSIASESATQTVSR